MRSAPKSRRGATSSPIAGRRVHRRASPAAQRRSPRKGGARMSEKRSLVELIAGGLFARAAETLVGECAPELPMLVYNSRLPDPQFQTIRDWSERLLSAEPWAAFDLEDLPGLFHALNIAMLSCYAYAPHEDRADPPRPGAGSICASPTPAVRSSSSAPAPRRASSRSPSTAPRVRRSSTRRTESSTRSSMRSPPPSPAPAGGSQERSRSTCCAGVQPARHRFGDGGLFDRPLNRLVC